MPHITPMPRTLPRHILVVLNITIFACAALLIGVASYDTFRTHSFQSTPYYAKLQFWICILFLLDLLVEYLFAPSRPHYLKTHAIYIPLCIPYVSILNAIGYTPNPEWAFALHLIPLIRAVCLLATILSAMRLGRAAGMFGAYLALLIVIVYFSSIMFYVAEYGHNPALHSYRSAVYWAIMALTTTGSEIQEYTIIGDALAAILAATGLMLFPVFTVYITKAVVRKTDDDDNTSPVSDNHATTTEASSAPGKYDSSPYPAATKDAPQSRHSDIPK